MKQDLTPTGPPRGEQQSIFEALRTPPPPRVAPLVANSALLSP